jgi:hypothetical protein
VLVKRSILSPAEKDNFIKVFNQANAVNVRPPNSYHVGFFQSADLELPFQEQACRFDVETVVQAARTNSK